VLPTRESKKEIVIELYKDGANIRDIARKVHISFSDIGKILRESTGQKEPKPEKSNTAKAFQLFSRGISLTNVTIQLDLNPREVEDMYTSFLGLQGLETIVKFIEEIKEYKVDFLKYVDICKNNKAEKQKILQIFSINKVTHHIETRNSMLLSEFSAQHAKLDNLKREIEKLKQEKANEWYSTGAHLNNGNF